MNAEAGCLFIVRSRVFAERMLRLVRIDLCYTQTAHLEVME